MTRSAVPDWLRACTESAHLSEVVRVLNAREATRRHARLSSRLLTESHHDVSSVYLQAFLSPYTTHYAISASVHPDNHTHNRYADITAYDRTRVVVHDCHPSGFGKQGEGRYLNASWVRERIGGKWWIASQAPLPTSAHAFLSLMLSPIANPFDGSQPGSRVRTVVQLTRNEEGGRRKADEYFPSIVGESTTLYSAHGDGLLPLTVKLESQKPVEENHCVISTVSIQPLTSSKDGPKPHTFKHLFFYAWPDHGVADCVGLVNFARLVDQTNKEVPAGVDGSVDPDPPIIVGCSAGIGRTGSFVAVISLLRGCNLLSQDHGPPIETPALSDPLPPSPIGPLPDELKNDFVALEIDSLREQRPGMVERKEQILLVYQTLVSAYERIGA